MCLEVHTCMEKFVDLLNYSKDQFINSVSLSGTGGGEGGQQNA